MLERAKKGVGLVFKRDHHTSADATTASDRAGEAVASRGGGRAGQGSVVKDWQGLYRHVTYAFTLDLSTIVSRDHDNSTLTCTMSDSENEATVLGKRERDEQNVAPAADASANDDESDEDIGPMPIPSDANGIVKKKRKGEYITPTLALDPSLSLN